MDETRKVSDQKHDQNGLDQNSKIDEIKDLQITSDVSSTLAISQFATSLEGEVIPHATSINQDGASVGTLAKSGEECKQWNSAFQPGCGFTNGM